MQPTVESFRALARSSPWRWASLHATRLRGGESVEAWVRRPGELLVRPADGTTHHVTGVPYSMSGPVSSGGADPVLRPDGLVAERPEGWHLEHGDPMWQDYTWTAMLDPYELSHHVVLTDVRRSDRGGRATWQARLVPESGYDPRCGCCPLLWSEVAMRAEYGDEPEPVGRFLAEGFPDAHDVALDVQTGVVVALEPVGGAHARGFTLEIHEVDGDLDAAFAGTRQG